MLIFNSLDNFVIRQFFTYNLKTTEKMSSTFRFADLKLLQTEFVSENP